MIKVRRSTIVDKSTDEVWGVLRDFNGHDAWHPSIADSQIERSGDSDRVGCIRKFHLEDGSELREQLLSLSDMEQSFSYCLLDTPIPLFNYVAHVRLFPVTDTDSTFWVWESAFNTLNNEVENMRQLVERDIYDAGFYAIKTYLENGVA